ncbi:MAG: hypothetical protein IPK16_28525 [Anaerolineales bacterium]|nr:hypothetical protein [Anaerolineales bacterium]
MADSTVTAGTPWLELLLLVGGALILWGAAALLVFRYLRRSRRLSNLASDDAATEIVRVVGEEAPFAYLMAEEEYRPPRWRSGSFVAVP